MELTEDIKNYIQSVTLNRQQLADKFGVGVTTIQRIMNDREVSVKTLTYIHTQILAKGNES